MKKFRFHLESYLKLKKVREKQKLGELARVMGRVNVFRAQQRCGYGAIRQHGISRSSKAR